MCRLCGRSHHRLDRSNRDRLSPSTMRQCRIYAVSQDFSNRCCGLLARTHRKPSPPTDNRAVAARYVTIRFAAMFGNRKADSSHLVREKLLSAAQSSPILKSSDGRYADEHARPTMRRRQILQKENPWRSTDSLSPNTASPE